MDPNINEFDVRVDPAVLDRAVDDLVANDPKAFVSTLGDDGFVVPAPDSFDLADRLVTWRDDRTLMLDVVVPDDKIAIVVAWETARKRGMGAVSVRLASDPRHIMTLSLIDQRRRYGVWLAVFTHDAATPEAAPVYVERSIAPLRPRTVSMHKSWTAIVTAIDEDFTRLMGWTPEMIVGQRSLEFIHPDDHQRAIDNWVGMLGSRVGQRARYRHRCLDGQWLWVEVDNEYIHADDPDEIDVRCRVTDISDEMAAHEALARNEALFRRLAESLPTGVFQVEPDLSITYANGRTEEILGIERQATLAEQISTVTDADRPSLDEALNAVFTQGVDREVEVQVEHPGSGERRLCTMTLVAVPVEDGTPGVIVAINDVTDSARLRDELKSMATFDPLTGCYNRRAFMAALDSLLTGPGSPAAAVVFVDLDKFKPINDRLGHAAGDELLVHVANSIRDLLRGDDIVGRIGGDEFLIACHGVGEPREALAIAERVRGALNGRVLLSAGVVELQASIGVAYAGGPTTREALVARADTAMYESKRAGEGRPVLHSGGERRRSSSRPRSTR